jgi:hypothetical protein
LVSFNKSMTSNILVCHNAIKVQDKEKLIPLMLNNSQTTWIHDLKTNVVLTYMVNPRYVHGYVYGCHKTYSLDMSYSSYPCSLQYIGFLGANIPILKCTNLAFFNFHIMLEVELRDMRSLGREG